ncbi:DNA repair protein rhp42 [Fusarium oxysporum f. sp. albedinis]|nr:DNA repair protein rhp42 [Fusarium oxysporum f. sp. albedinis]
MDEGFFFMASRSYLSTATSIKLRFSNLGSSLFPTAGSATPVLRAVHKSLNPRYVLHLSYDRKSSLYHVEIRCTFIDHLRENFINYHASYRDEFLFRDALVFESLPIGLTIVSSAGGCQNALELVG